MPGQRSVRLVLLVLAGLIATLGADAAVAQAEYGEVGSPIEEVGKVNEQQVHAFGVEPVSHSLYVADEVPRTETYRIQKFDSSGQALAEVRFKANPNSNSSILEKSALQGVAIDSAAKRIYLLEAQTAAEELDPEASAAAILYAFSTEPEDGKLVPATGTKAGGVLAELKPESTKTKTALLNPHGIAVDPANGDVVILGQEDEQPSGEEPSLRTAVQLVKPNGELGSRYVDLENCLDGADGSKEPACEEESPGREVEPFSPIVSQSGRIYVERTGEVWAIPAAAETHPKRLFALGSGQTLIEFPKGEVTAEATGSSMAFVSEGADEGRIYLTAGINNSAGILALAYVERGESSEAKELGWTGGQSEASAAKCVVPQAGSEGLWLASGGDEDVFVFDPRRRGVLTPRPASVDVFEFGPGGEGCPHASATPPTVKVEEKTISPVPLGKTATLSSEVSEANAEGAEWKFKDLTTGQEEAPADTGYQFQITSLEHQFEHAGEYEVTEIIETDDFATPKLEVTQKVQVGEEHLAVELSYPETAIVGRPAGFEAKVFDSHEPHDPHLEYVWRFGDGTEQREKATTTELSAQHTYMAEGTESVTLEVTDAHGSSWRSDPGRFGGQGRS